MKNNLKHFRKLNKLTLQKLADMSDVSKTHIHDLEKNKSSNPTLTVAYKICGVLNLNIEDIWTNNIKIVETSITERYVVRNSKP